MSQINKLAEKVLTSPKSPFESYGDEPVVENSSSATPLIRTSKRGPEPTCVPRLPQQLSWGKENITLKDLELMHHYTTTTYLAFVDYEVYRPVWQVVVPQEAQTYRFLMHLILAVSALHIDHLQPPANRHGLEYKELAQKHYDSAIATFTSSVAETNRSNVSAVFAFSHITIFFAFGSSRFSPDDKPMEDPIGDLLEVFALLRSAMKSLRSAWESIAASPMAILLQRGPEIKDRQYLPSDVSMALELVEQLCEQQLHLLVPDGEVDAEVVRVYQTAIQQLWDCFVMAETKRKDWGMALRFPINFSDRFLACLTRRDPAALVILAHYCVILHRAPARWWTEGWSVQVIRAVFMMLDQDWKYSISWPMEAVGLHQVS
ncbi:hypothetical protein FQN55_001379 [Onygenales sp. PD_40]|nr:hypothetical protein FQN55_001379 [Onygenales sp. PD_40]